MSEDEDKLRKRLREREDEQEARERAEKAKNRDGGVVSNKEAIGEKVDELLLRADPLIEQLNNLYNIYISGTERNPPNERRKHLDQIMATLQNISKPSAGLLYRYTSLASKYQTYKNRWDKVLKDLEDGKIKRRVVPNRG
jgi:hypothetical protein